MDDDPESDNRLMSGPRANGSGASGEEQTPVAYALADPELRAYDHGLGTLRVEGELKGYLASIVATMRFPSVQPWPWFVVVWADGTKERSFEDYGPSWWTVRELDAGFLQHYGPSVSSENRIFGKRIAGSVPGPPCRYDFEWLPAAEAATKWKALGLVDSDF